MRYAGRYDGYKRMWVYSFEVRAYYLSAERLRGKVGAVHNTFRREHMTMRIYISCTHTYNTVKTIGIEIRRLLDIIDGTGGAAGVRL
jgi:hypothetical protein